MIRAVRSEKRHGDSSLAHHVPETFQIFLIITERAVFIFHLEHEHRSALIDLKRRQQWHQTVIIVPYMAQIPLVAGPQIHFFPGQKPERQASEIPFRTNIRRRAQYYPQPQPLCRPDKGNHVQHSMNVFPIKIKFSFYRLMHVPGNVRFHCIAAQLFELLQPVLPVFRKDPEIVDPS